MTTNHTPGPWTVGRCSWNEDGNVCYELEGIKQGCASDARLIAAAPELLEALKRLVSTGLDERTHHKIMSCPAHYVNVAIAKATGGES